MTQNLSNPNWNLPPPDPLNLLRQQVDQVDQKLLGLLKERVHLSRQIGLTKREQQTPVYAPERERAVLAKLLQENQDEIDPMVLRAIYREILAGSRLAQNPAPLAYIGTDLVYWAARAQLGEAERLVSCDGWQKVTEGVTQGRFRAALVPIQRLVWILERLPKPEEWCEKWSVVRLLSGDAQLPHAWENSIAQVCLKASLPSGNLPCNRILVLIRCKNGESTVNNLQSAMAVSLTANHVSINHAPDEPGSEISLAQIATETHLSSLILEQLSQKAQQLQLPVPCVLGTYWHGDDHGG